MGGLIRIGPGPVAGRAAAPPSKSVTHRAYLLAAQSDVPCTVESPLRSADTDAMLACLVRLGAAATVEGTAVRFSPGPLRAPAEPLDCRNAGTALRLLAATAARLPAPTLLTGDASLRSRPNGPLLAALAALGARVDSLDGQAPLRVGGPIRPGIVRLPPGASSQFASALLLSLPFLDGPSQVVLEPPVASRPYLDVTREVAGSFGVALRSDGDAWDVAPATPRAGRFRVEGDWSAAANLFAAAAVTGGDVEVTGLDAGSAQGDRAILGHLAAFGCRAGPGARVQGGPLAAPGTVDVAATPDLLPVLAVVAAFARGTTRFTGASQLRLKESDRLAAVAENLRRMGIACRSGPDWLAVEGRRPRGAALSSFGDHRVHMAFAVAALGAQGPSALDDPGAAAVSWPGFHAALRGLGARVAEDSLKHREEVAAR